MKISSSKLTTCNVARDGEAVELWLLENSGLAVCVELPFDQAESVVMTLPRLLARALKKRTGGEQSRYVFRVDEWSLERAQDHNCLVATLKTVDGFEVSLGIPFDMCRALGTSLHDEGEEAIQTLGLADKTLGCPSHRVRRS
jgi:hypothetical protein